jgi:hypothetical protein
MSVRRELIQLEYVQEKTLVCDSFDTDCFGLDGDYCRKEKIHIFDDVLIHIEEASGICPMAR